MIGEADKQEQQNTFKVSKAFRRHGHDRGVTVLHFECVSVEPTRRRRRPQVLEPLGAIEETVQSEVARVV